MTSDGIVGQCGLGNLGGAIAGRLVRRGPVVGFDPDPERAAAAAADGVRLVDSVGEVGAQASAVVMSLPGPDHSRAVVDELLETMAPGGLVIETSTVAPSDVHDMAARCRARDVGFVDSAVLSGVGNMRAGRGRLLVAGDPADVARAEEVLEALTDNRVVLGESGAAMAAKVVNNAVAHALYVVLAEAAAMGEAAGVPLETFIELMKDERSGLTRPLEHRIAERFANHEFADGMPTDMAYKDSVLALELARSHEVPLFAIQASHSVYEIARAQGLGRLDYASVATLWEQWLDRRFGSG